MFSEFERREDCSNELTPSPGFRWPSIAQICLTGKIIHHVSNFFFTFTPWTRVSSKMGKSLFVRRKKLTICELIQKLKFFSPICGKFCFFVLQKFRIFSRYWFIRNFVKDTKIFSKLQRFFCLKNLSSFREKKTEIPRKS